ncbi:MAG: polymer-forming cytoskeletal protein [Prolixibacteraceae bacterium]
MEVPTLINAFSKINGELVLTTDLRIDGQIFGKVESDENIVIGSAGLVNGFLRAKNLVIYGRIEGNVVVSGVTTLHPQSAIFGNLYTKLIEVKEGAILTARVITFEKFNNSDMELVKMGKSIGTLKPNLANIPGEINEKNESSSIEESDPTMPANDLLNFELDGTPEGPETVLLNDSTPEGPEAILPEESTPENPETILLNESIPEGSETILIDENIPESPESIILNESIQESYEAVLLDENAEIAMDENQEADLDENIEEELVEAKVNEQEEINILDQDLEGTETSEVINSEIIAAEVSKIDENLNDIQETGDILLDEAKEQEEYWNHLAEPKLISSFFGPPIKDYSDSN